MHRPFIASLLEQAVTSTEDPLLAGQGTSDPEGDRCETIFGLYAGGVPLREIAHALGCSVLTAQDDIEQARSRRPALDSREDRVSWELHRAVADKLRGDSGPVIAAASNYLGRVHGPHADEWRSLLDGDVLRLIHEMLAPGEHAAALRRATPFADVLTSDERLAAIRKAAVPASL